MNVDRIRDRKSRIVLQRANGRAAEWRAVGSITIVAAHWNRPLHLDGGGYTVHLREDPADDQLQEAVIFFHRIKSASWAQLIATAFVFLALGIGLTRLVFLSVR